MKTNKLRTVTIIGLSIIYLGLFIMILSGCGKKDNPTPSTPNGPSKNKVSITIDSTSWTASSSSFTIGGGDTVISSVPPVSGHVDRDMLAMSGNGESLTIQFVTPLNTTTQVTYYPFGKTAPPQNYNYQGYAKYIDKAGNVYYNKYNGTFYINQILTSSTPFEYIGTFNVQVYCSFNGETKNISGSYDVFN